MRIKKWHVFFKYCDTLRTGGFGDWYIPVLRELESMYSDTAYSEPFGNNYRSPYNSARMDLLNNTLQSLINRGIPAMVLGIKLPDEREDYWTSTEYPSRFPNAGNAYTVCFAVFEDTAGVRRTFKIYDDLIVRPIRKF